VSQSIDQALETYKMDPTPSNKRFVVDSLKPTIDYALVNLGVADDSYMRSKARVLAGRAIDKYDPQHGAALHTWVSRQLMPLRRERRQTQSIVKVPERIQLDAVGLMKAEREFIDKHNREPDVDELADASRLSPKRIKRIRETMRPVPSEVAFEGILPGAESDFLEEALEYVYKDSDLIDKKIIEMKMGYGGSSMYAPKDVATRLNLTAPQLSRRSMRLAHKIQQLEQALTNI
jgi:hypothetical protein